MVAVPPVRLGSVTGWFAASEFWLEGVEGADNFYLSNTTQEEGDGADCGRVEGNVHEGQAMFYV